MFADKAEDLKIVVVGTSSMTFDITGTPEIHADIYAPQMALTMHGTGDIYGTLVAKSIDMSGNAGIHYDKALYGGVTLVK